MRKRLDDERWREVDALFDEALDVEYDEWPSFLAERCGEDEDLLRAVSELLIAEGEARHFLGDSAGQVAARALMDSLQEKASQMPADRSGERVGVWHLIRRIGQGGMAGVYLAERVEAEFSQTVAIKFIRRGLDSEDFVRRFLTERRILSSLHHPNIAGMIDGGRTEDGHPYLVLEYVEGMPITEYCDANRYTVSERLKLFLDAANAVQYAHANLVIHRDIKPSNIHVTVDGHVKLLDFGIAKLLDADADPDATQLTRTGFRPLTPEYASPEQVRGDPITTASDVYQLGVLLYRMLTGERPYEGTASTRALEDAITETRPTAPSVAARRLDDRAAGRRGETAARLGRRLRGDLDMIVLKSLRKEPERRYGSVVEFAEDVRRHLAGRPILARPESRVYRARKFLQRNPWVAPVSIGAVILLVAYVGTLIRHGRQVEAERNDARAEAARADAAQSFLVGLFESADPFATVPESRRDIRVSDVMEEGVRRARSELSDNPELRATMLGTIGDVFVGLGDPARGKALREEAYETTQLAFGEGSPQAVSALRDIVEPTLQLDRLTAGWSDSAVVVALRALDAARASLGPGHIEALRAEVTLGRALQFGRSGYLLAEPILRHAIAGMRGKEGVGTGELAEALLTLARVLRGTSHGDRAEAEELAREAVSLLSLELGPEHARVRTAQVWLANVIEDPDEAVRLSEIAGAGLDSLLGPDHELSIRALHSYGTELKQAGRFGAAADVFREAAERRGRRDGRTGFWYALYRRAFADAARLSGDHRGAVAAYDEIIELSGTGGAVAHRLSRAQSLVGVGRADAALQEARHVADEISGTSAPLEAAADCVAGLANEALGRTVAAARSLASAASRLDEAEYQPVLEHPCYGVPLPAPGS